MHMFRAPCGGDPRQFPRSGCEVMTVLFHALQSRQCTTPDVGLIGHNNIPLPIKSTSRSQISQFRGFRDANISAIFGSKRLVLWGLCLCSNMGCNHAKAPGVEDRATWGWYGIIGIKVIGTPWEPCNCWDSMGYHGTPWDTICHKLAKLRSNSDGDLVMKMPSYR